MPFTKEQLIAKAREQIEFCRNTKITGEGRVHVNQCSALFEIALAALTAEPVMFCMEIGGTLDEQSVSDCQSVVSAWVEEWNNHDRSPGEPAYKTVALFRLPLLEGGNNVE